MNDIKKNIQKINQDLDALKAKLGRQDEEITLVAVTKTHPVEEIEAALKCGIMHIGENKVQDSLRKLPMIMQPYTGFHFLGHMQTNKINQLLSLNPYLIQSVDSVYLAEKLNRALGNRNRKMDILIQVNTTQEEQKSGVNFENAMDLFWKIASYSCLRVRGLMTIGKLSVNPETSRPYFRQLKTMYDELKTKGVENIDFLSMGMSHDWKIAVEEGSNMIRIGSAIFGERHYGEDI